MNPLIQEQKMNLRLELKEKRQAIGQERRKQAESEALEALVSIIRSYPFVLSYESFNDELSTTALNHILEEEGKLLLPKITPLGIKACRVKDRQTELFRSSMGFLEPKNICPEVDPQNIPLVLVPALGFDGQKHRIGYGKGHYDHFLKSLNEEAITLGIGFREQFSPKHFPIEERDQTLSTILLF